VPRSGPLTKLGLCLLCASLFTIPSISRAQNSSALQPQINEHEQKLAAARAAHLLPAQATELNTLASLYRQVGKRQQAVDYCNQAL
jgi:hypothetical protein